MANRKTGQGRWSGRAAWTGTAFAAALLAFCLAAWAGPGMVRWKVLGVLDHDPDAFTQGLVFHHGRLYESTGLYGRSSLRELDPATGKVLRGARLPGRLFGEGLAVAGDKLVQLTWKAGFALVWNPLTLVPEGRRTYPGEGWGLTALGPNLAMSNGSSVLFFRRPMDFSLVRQVRVRDRDRPVANLNELEEVRGFVWCNVWHSDRVAVVDPADGRVLAWADFSPLRAQLPAPGEALNGLAWNPQTKSLYVTGKNWPRLFTIQIQSAPGF